MTAPGTAAGSGEQGRSGSAASPAEPSASGGEPAVLARRIAERVRALPDVLDLAAGSFGTVAMPVPGGRIDGVIVRDTAVEIGVVVRYGRPIPEIAAGIRDTVAPMVQGRTVDVFVGDVADEETG